MFSNIIINGVQNGKSNDEIIADIEVFFKASISGSTKDFIVDDIKWYRSNPYYNSAFFPSEASIRPFKTESF